MSEVGFPENPPSTTEASSQRIIPFTEVTGVDLKPGDGIGGVVTLQDLDRFVDLLSVKFSGRSFGGRVIGYATKEPIKKVLSDCFRTDERRRRFYGPIRDFEITVLPPEPLEDSSKTLSFYAKGKIYSTGKGDIGFVERVNTLFVGVHGNPALRSRALNRREVEKISEQAVRESKLSAYLAYAQALRNIVSGGLPSLGKKQ